MLPAALIYPPVQERIEFSDARSVGIDPVCFDKPKRIIHERIFLCIKYSVTVNILYYSHVCVLPPLEFFSFVAIQ